MSRDRAGAARRRRALLAAAIGVAVWGGCSVNEKNYGLLSFFFDGVPEPGSAAARASAAGRGGAGERQGFVSAGAVSAHSAYVEQRCGDCHGAGAKFGLFAEGFEKLDDGVCLKCHAPVLQDVPLLHGPVAAQACLWCHLPHESPELDLLSAPSPALCLQCHKFQLQEAPPIAPHEDLGRDCLECHLGHGGPERYFLRPAGAPPPAGGGQG